MHGSESWLILTLEGLEEVGDEASLDLVLTAKPLIVPGKVDAQGLTIRVNGAEIFTTSLREEGSTLCRIPIALARAQSPLRICFVHPDAARPCDVIEGSTDKKPLALAVREIVLKRSS